MSQKRKRLRAALFSISVALVKYIDLFILWLDINDLVIDICMLSVELVSSARSKSPYVAQLEDSIRHYYIGRFDPLKSARECGIPHAFYHELLKEATSIALFSVLSFWKDKQTILSFMRWATPSTSDSIWARTSREVQSILLLWRELDTISIQTDWLDAYLKQRWQDDSDLLLQDLLSLFTTYATPHLDWNQLDVTQYCFFGNKQQVFFVSLEELVIVVHCLIFWPKGDFSLRRKTNLVFSYLSLRCQQEKEVLSWKEACLAFCKENSLPIANFLMHIAGQCVSTMKNRFLIKENITFAYYDKNMVLSKQDIADLVVLMYGIVDEGQQQTFLLYLATLAKNERVQYYDTDLKAYRLMLVWYAQSWLQELLTAA